MKALFTFFILLFSLTIFGQREYLKPCGTIDHRSEWLQEFQKNPSNYETRTNVIIWVPMSVTLVGFDDGTRLPSERTIHEALCTLNDDYAESEIQFYLAAPIRYIYNTSYADHQTVLQGAQMMFENNLPNMINNYVMDNAAGNCGYNLPYAGIALSTNCTQATDHTWAHEVGHNLSLPHPFLGWEGGVSHHNSVSHNFNDPAPEKILYDYTFFQDTLILDTLIIDTSYVEKVDGSNCTYAADGFCDTKPDYIAGRWPCDEDGFNLVEQTDPNGEKFFSDGSLIMSYATDNCSHRFSDDQIAAMRANLIDEKSSYLGNEDVLAPVPDMEVDVLTPDYLEEVYYQDVYIEWEPVENATGYSIQIALTASYGLTVFDTIVYDNHVSISEMQFPTKKHYFRVKAFNNYSFCNDFHAFGAFETTDTQTSIEEQFLNSIKVTPSLLNAGESIRIDNQDGKEFSLTISNILGNQIYNSVTSQKITQVQTEGWAPGVYLISFEKGEALVTQKVSIIR